MNGFTTLVLMAVSLIGSNDNFLVHLLWNLPVTTIDFEHLRSNVVKTNLITSVVIINLLTNVVLTNL